jgi:hypothetical protein
MMIFKNKIILKVVSTELFNNTSQGDDEIKPRIEGSNFDEAFYLSQFHFHWGRNNSQG